jgi:transketolase
MIRTEYKSVINNLKRKILFAASTSKEGHIPSAFSIIDILYVLYNEILNVDPVALNDDLRDRFILSKGHASLALYAILANKGFFPINELDKFCSYDGMLGGHPDSLKVPGIEASTGSLGHGFPLSAGVALGLKIKKNNARVFVIIGDGECNEGTIWETALIASNHKLNNITCIVDYNHSNDRALKLGDIAAKFASFGWEPFTVNGHDHEILSEVLKQRNDEKPVAIIAETIKGKGIKEMENNLAWHHRSPNKQELQKMLEELDQLDQDEKAVS